MQPRIMSTRATGVRQLIRRRRTLAGSWRRSAVTSARRRSSSVFSSASAALETQLQLSFLAGLGPQPAAGSGSLRVSGNTDTSWRLRRTATTMSRSCHRGCPRPGPSPRPGRSAVIATLLDGTRFPAAEPEAQLPGRLVTVQAPARASARWLSRTTPAATARTARRYLQLREADHLRSPGAPLADLRQTGRFTGVRFPVELPCAVAGRAVVVSSIQVRLSHPPKCHLGILSRSSLISPTTDLPCGMVSPRVSLPRIRGRGRDDLGVHPAGRWSRAVA